MWLSLAIMLRNPIITARGDCNAELSYSPPAENYTNMLYSPRYPVNVTFQGTAAQLSHIFRDLFIRV